jgi:hypothetical protein
MKKQNHVFKTLFLIVVLLSAVIRVNSQTTWYSYQSGSWDDPEIWTTEPGGTTKVNPGNSVPGNGDAVVILPSRTVTLRNGNVTSTGLDITIQAAGILDDSIYVFSSALSGLHGQGTIKLKTGNFPSATLNTFTQEGGGTTEFYNTSDFTLPLTQGVYNNLTINCTGFTATQAGNIIVNGDLKIQSGTFQINDGTANRRSLTIFGNIFVNTGSTLKVSTGKTNTTTNPTSVGTGGTAPFLDYYISQSHRVEIYGNLINNGTVKFTNQAYPDYNNFPENGFASVFFKGAGDKTMTCNGTTDFYNLIIDKGTDHTYKLTVNSSGYDKFRIFGANTASEFTGYDENNPNIRKALWIRSGTLILKGRVFIPSLVEGTASGSGDYYIPGNGALVLDSPDAVVMGTIDDYRVVNLAYGVSAPDNATIGITTVPSVVPSGFSIYGSMQINDGYLYIGEIGRIIVFGTSAQFIVNGGTIDAKQFQSAGTGKASFRQSGGDLILRGRFQRNLDYSSVLALISSIGDPGRLNTQRAYYGTSTPLGTEPSVGTLSIYQDATAFHMEGGSIKIYDPSGSASPSRAVQINSDPANINVSGGNIEVFLTAGTGNVSGGVADASYGIATKAPFYNLTVTRISGSQSAVLLAIPGSPPSGVTAVPDPPLKVLNNLTLTEPSANAAVVLNASGFDVKVGGNFIINANAEYTPGTNRTILNGTGVQAFSNNGTITSGLNKLIIDKESGTVTLGSSFTVRDSLAILSGTLADGGYSLYVAGNIHTAGTHTGNGKIILNGTATQYLSASVSGDPSLGNIEITNASGSNGTIVAILVSDLSINSLTLTSSRVFNISQYRLTVGPGGIATGLTYSVNRMIRCNGLASDGGLRRYINNSYNGQTVLFPVGSPGGPISTALAYFPGRMHLGNVTTPGYFTVVPVANYHPSCHVSKQNEALDFYWKTKISDLATSGTRHLEFDYRINIPNSYNNPYYLISATWGTGSGINNSRTLIFPTSIGIPSGDFTSGKNSPFRNPTTYFSRQSGAWNSSSGGFYTTWSLTGHDGSAVPTGTGLPQNYDNVIIGGIPGSRNDSVTVTGNGITAAIITINDSYTGDGRNPVLNIQSTTGHTIDILRGGGKFCTSTAAIPASNTDYGDFINNNNAIFCFYGPSYTLPASLNTYPNLQISGGNTKYINTASIIVRGNLIIADNLNPNNTLSLNATSGDLTVYGDIQFSNGGKILVPVSATSRNINIYGDIDFEFGNSFNTGRIEAVNGAGTVHKLYFYGDTIFSGASDLLFNPALANKIDLYLKDKGCTVITSGTGSFNLNRLFISKDSKSDTVYFKNNFTLNETNNSTQNKSLNLAAGILILSDTNNSLPSMINLNLTSGGTNYFNMNNSSGLILRNGSKINITGNTAGSGIRLDGLLKAEGHSEINFADGTSINTGYIEYTNSGNAVLSISGTSVLKASQIRRSLLLTTGIISYTQSENSVSTIYGSGASTERSKFEVTGTGSSFGMSGNSVLSIINGGGNTPFGDLYLRPETSSVTGGTIIFGNGVNNQTYYVDAGIYLNNLTLNTTGTANTINLMTNPLLLNGSLLISNANSILNTNNLNVTVMGNFTNNGIYNSGTNNTILSGTDQILGGNTITGFFNLTVNTVNSLSLSQNVQVNNSLSVSSGTVICSSFDIEVKGNVMNNGIISSDSNPATSRLYLHGNSLQYIGGTGTFGRIELDNPSGARLINDLSVNQDLILTSGILNINKYLLVLGANSNIQGSGFGVSKMILPDGVLSNVGIRKHFSEEYSGTFTYPIGVSGKYTPATIIVSSTGAGFVRINTINEIHPATLTPFNALNYYWEAESSVTEFQGSFILNYDVSDVVGNESSYVAARLVIPPGTHWNKASSGSTTDNVNEVTHVITFDFPDATNNLGGHYTSGEDASIPNIIPVYTSNVISGDWETPSSWIPEAPAGGPNGSIVVIQPGHTINATANRRFCYNLTINGVLDVGKTYDHNMGTVSGTGTLKISSPVIPAGRFDSFLSCSGGTLEFSGDNDYTLIADRIDTLKNLHFTGTGKRILPDKNLVICNQLQINGPVLDNSVNNRKLSLGGTFDLIAGIFLSGSGDSAIVAFIGESVQTIANFNNSSGSPLNNLQINNSNGLTLNSSIDINGDLILSNGVITTSETNILRMNNPVGTAISVPEGGSSYSYVNGPMSVYLFSGSDFLFPSGKASRYGKIRLFNAQSGTWQAEYFNSQFANISVSGTLNSVSNTEYWKVKSPADGATAKIQLRWDYQSDISPLNLVNGINDIKVSEFNGTSWVDKISLAQAVDNNNGTVQTTSNITINNTTDPQHYTLGSVSTVKPSIILGPGPRVYSCSVSAGLTYTATTRNPDQFIITYDAAAQAQGFENVLSWTSLPPTPIVLTIPEGILSGVFNATIQVRASGNPSNISNPAPFAVTILPGMTWTGAINTDWNTSGNWSCRTTPGPVTSILIPDVPNKPFLNSGATGAVNDITIEAGSSLVISGNTLQISGTITNYGTFDATSGTIEMNGTSTQVISSSSFSSNTIRNLIVNNPAGVTLAGPLNVTGILRTQEGTFASGGFLTLSSSGTGTALIDPAGTGNVTGNVTMQRYLPSAFGYKYISSPFLGATVSQLADELVLSGEFPVIFRYNEGSTTSGWSDYVTPSGLLNPLMGYAANFGSSAEPITADITGIVNDGPISITLYNNNNPFTQGYNLIGNPYPSPINWISAGWTKTNIDNALYYFKASESDEYGGQYSTWINGVSSDSIVSNIIPSMQGFFVHVTAGPPWPVTGTLSVNNSVRVTDMNPAFTKSEGEARIPLIRLSAGFESEPGISDKAVIYFDEKATTGFDNELDALKLMNTDYSVPNLYFPGTDGNKLSISAIPDCYDTLHTIPCGLKINTSGKIVISIPFIAEELSDKKISVYDKVTGIDYDLSDRQEYKVFLNAGEYTGRFYLNLRSIATEIPDTRPDGGIFSVYSSGGMIRSNINLYRSGSGNLSVLNLAGQILFIKKISESGYYEFNPGLNDGFYIVNFVAKNFRSSKKIFFQNR